MKYRIIAIISLATLSTWMALSANRQGDSKPEAASSLADNSCDSLGTLGKPGKAGILLCRKGYALAFDPDAKTPLWVVENLTRDRAQIFDKGRRRGFRADPDLPKGTSPRNEDFIGEVYDRGHMAPAEDSDWDAEASRQTFYLSNVAPMMGKRLNRTLWRRLEEEVRSWAQCSDNLYVVTGPVLPTDRTRAMRIGTTGILIPTHFYKVIFQPNTRRATAFLVPNAEHEGKEYERFATSIDEVEKRTGLNFLSALPDTVETEVESRIFRTPWRITNRGLDCQLQAG